MQKIILSIISRLKSKTKRLFATINEALNKSSKGALIGSILAVFICFLYLTEEIRSGFFSLVTDRLLVLLAVIVFPFIYFVCAYCLYQVLRNTNRFIVMAVIMAILIIVTLPNEKINGFFTFLSIVSGILVGIGVNKKVNSKIRMALLVVTVLANAIIFTLLFSKGTKNAIPISNAYWTQQGIGQSKMVVSPLSENDYPVGQLFYGSGTDKHREEYNRDVSIQTQSVNGLPFLKITSRIKPMLRKAYWGFDASALPINARVWYPKANGVFPLVIVVHGNHFMADYSDPGYEYLGKQLASQGFIVASIDENFLNESWFDDFWFQEMNIRAWLILKHLENWQKWSTTKGNPFEGRVDMSNICLIGHSRGADAVALAFGFNKLSHYPFDGNVRFNFNFAIKSLVQIAPTERQITESEFPLAIRNVNYLLLQGSHDQDIFYCAGAKMYNSIKLDDTANCKKALVYIYKANHGQFNSNWGAKDREFPEQLFMNVKNLLSGEQQRSIAKAYISTFLHATLKGQNDYLPLLKDCRAGFGFLPHDYYINQYEDGTFKYIADFEEDHELTSASMPEFTIEAEGLSEWAEHILPLRSNEEMGQANMGVFLGWKQERQNRQYPYYSISLSNREVKRSLSDSLKNICLFIANNSDTVNTVDFSIQIKTQLGVITKDFNDFYKLPPLLKTPLAKWNFIKDFKKDMPIERVLQYVQIPLAAFSTPNAPPVTPRQIQQIKFIFNKQPEGNIILDKIGFN